MFLINPPSGNVRIQKLIAEHIFQCSEKRKGGGGKVNTQGLSPSGTQEPLSSVNLCNFAHPLAIMDMCVCDMCASTANEKALGFVR